MIKNFKIIISIAIFFFTLLVLSCNNKTTPTISTSSLLKSSKKILALGDSYTIGQSVSEEERYINQAISVINKNGIKIKATLQIIAETGWTTLDLLDEIKVDSSSIIPPYDIVTLQIGVNDQFQQFNMENYYTNFTMCLKKALQCSGNLNSHVFVLSIPDYGVTPFGGNNAVRIGREIDKYNAINKKISFQFGVNYIDITSSSRMAVADRSLVSNDGLHPSGKEYFKWANLLAAKMLPLMK